MFVPQFGCEAWLNVWEKRATYDISQSTITSFTLKELISMGPLSEQAFFDGFANQVFSYGWIEGSPEFKQAVSETYAHVSPDRIIQTNGGTGGDLLALMALVERGDHVIALHPSYQLLYDFPRSLGAEVDYWELSEEDGWNPSLDDLRRMIRPNTKVICINNANNPTGTVMDAAFLAEMVEIAQSVGAYILSDEVFTPLTDDISVPAIADIYDKGISVNSISKTYSVPGVRVGWIAANLEFIDLIRTYRDYTMICCGVFDDYVATYTLQNKDNVLRRNAAIVNENLGILKDWVDREPRVSLVLPRSCSISFIKLDIPMEVEEFCVNLLKDTGVLLIPGNRFDVPGHARLGYCCDREVLVKGLESLSGYLRRFD